MVADILDSLKPKDGSSIGLRDAIDAIDDAMLSIDERISTHASERAELIEGGASVDKILKLDERNRYDLIEHDRLIAFRQRLEQQLADMLARNEADDLTAERNEIQAEAIEYDAWLRGRYVELARELAVGLDRGRKLRKDIKRCAQKLSDYPEISPPALTVFSRNASHQLAFADDIVRLPIVGELSARPVIGGYTVIGYNFWWDGPPRSPESHSAPIPAQTSEPPLRGTRVFSPGPPGQLGFSHTVSEDGDEPA